MQTFDENYAASERRFKSLDTCVRALVRDISQYVDSLQVRFRRLL